MTGRDFSRSAELSIWWSILPSSGGGNRIEVISAVAMDDIIRETQQRLKSTGSFYMNRTLRKQK